MMTQSALSGTTGRQEEYNAHFASAGEAEVAVTVTEECKHSEEFQKVQNKSYQGSEAG